MRAIGYRSYGDFTENRLEAIPDPVPAEGEVLVQMRVAGINPLGNTFRAGAGWSAFATTG